MKTLGLSFFVPLEGPFVPIEMPFVPTGASGVPTGTLFVPDGRACVPNCRYTATSEQIAISKGPENPIYRGFRVSEGDALDYSVVKELSDNQSD